MSVTRVVGSAPTSWSSVSLFDLFYRFQSLSIGRRRSFHASCKRLAVPSLHGPSDRSNKGSKAASTWGDRSSGNKAVRAKNETAAKVDKKETDGEDVALQPSRLASNSIFADEIEQPSKHTLANPNKEPGSKEHERDARTLSLVLDPRPKARIAWQRRMVIRMLQKRGRLTKEEKLRRLERAHTSRSAFFKTSIKKLGSLARQIAGKTVDEAILQMRFSKKKAAQEVRAHLIHARNEAIASRGMGTDAAPASKPLHKKPFGPESTHDPSAARAEVMTSDPSILPVALETHNPILSLKRTQSTPETQLYIDQAWVNRGPYTNNLNRRARGRVDLIRHPSTGISVVLKEEKTRMREKQEKENKDRRKRLGNQLWKQLPDRKVYAQRPYYSW